MVVAICASVWSELNSVSNRESVIVSERCMRTGAVLMMCCCAAKGMGRDGEARRGTESRNRKREVGGGAEMNFIHI